MELRWQAEVEPMLQWLTRLADATAPPRVWVLPPLQPPPAAVRHAERLAAVWTRDKNKHVGRFAVLVASSNRSLEWLAHLPVYP